MAKTIETIIIKACENGDIQTLRGLISTKINIGSKSRAKGFETIFERALVKGISAKRNSKEVIEIICLLAKDKLNDLLKEELIIKIANMYKFYVLDIFIENGWSLGNSISDDNYKTFYDKLFRQSLACARVEILEYLMPKMNIKWLNLNKIVPFLVNNEEMVTIVESRLKSRNNDFICIYATLSQHGLSPKDIEKILANA